YGYDSYPNGITSITGDPRHDDVNYSSSFTARGNLTSITRYPTVLPSLSGGITQTLSYDSLGNVLSAQADCCTQLGFGFTSTAHSRVDKTTFDGSGRTLHSYVLNGPTTVTTVDTSYNDVARSVQTSNPHGPSETVSNSTVQFDPLGRPLSASAPSGGSTGYS